MREMAPPFELSIETTEYVSLSRLKIFHFLGRPGILDETHHEFIAILNIS